MDTRDKHLNRHMKQRFALAEQMPAQRRICWAEKCIARAARQQRTAFYLMANLWLGDCRQADSATAN